MENLGVRAARAAALLVGGSLVQAAAAVPLLWQMAVASRADLGGDVGEAWLPRLTAASVAAGVIVGGRLFDAGRRATALLAASAALALGCVLASWQPASPGAVLVGLGVVSSLAAGCLLATALSVVLTSRRSLSGLAAGLTLAAGMVAANRLFAAGSILALARGGGWLVGHAAWIGAAAALVGSALLHVGSRGEGRAAASPDRPSASDVADPGGGREGAFPFWLLAVLSFLASFGALAAQRGIAALATEGLPESSIASGVMAGMVLASYRPIGPIVAGLLHDLLGARWAVAATAATLGVAMAGLTRLAGPDAPWNAVAGVVGVANGMAVAAVPAACLSLLGPRRLGYHYGLLFLGFALGEVSAAALGPAVGAQPLAALVSLAVAAAAVVAAAFRLRPVGRVGR